MLLGSIIWALAAAGAPVRADEAERDVLAEQFAQGVEAYDAKNFARAFELWLPLAQNGDLAAQRNVAHLLRLGRGVEQDLPRARKFYEQSAEFGFVTAQTNLAVMLLNGEGGDENIEEAAMWFDRAAHGGHPIAQFNLARLYEQGRGVAPDMPRALGWYAAAARAGYKPALDRLADLVLTLPGPGTDAQTQQDERGTDETVEQKMSPGAEAPEETEEVREPEQPSLAEEPADTNNAADGAAATPDEFSGDESGDGLADADLLAKAVSSYEARDFDEAKYAFESLAYRGNADAQYWLARMRNRGEGDPRDPVAALAWWSVAGEAGHVRAAKAATALRAELGSRRRKEAEREAAQFKALISQLTGGSDQR